MLKLSAGRDPMFYSLPDQTGEAGIELIPICSSDAAFLFRVYASTREEEMIQTGWPEVDKQRFLLMQFELQDSHYRKYYEEAEYYKIVCRKEDIGRLYIAKSAEEIRVMELALLPFFRNRGIGSAIMRFIMKNGAAEKRIPVSLHVERYGRARRFYKSLGFEQISNTDTRILMKWTPTEDAIATLEALIWSE
jgi:GNAT superfamily N-acetyltransferase